MVALRRTQWRTALLQPVPQYHPAPELPHDKVRTIIFRLWHRMQAMLAASYSLCLTVLKVKLFSLCPHKDEKMKVHVQGGRVSVRIEEHFI